MEKDLTKGSIVKNLFSISFPTMIGFSFQMVYDIVDIFWIGKISAKAIAGVTIFGTIFWVVETLNEIIGVSSLSLLTQSFGKKDINRANTVIEQTITFKFLVAIIATLFMMIILKPLFTIFAKGDVIIYGLDYGNIRFLFLPIMFTSFSFNTILRSLGDAKTPMKIMVIATIINIILDPLLMFKSIELGYVFSNNISIKGLGLSIRGAAIATGISQIISFLAGFYLVFFKTVKVNPEIKKLFRLNSAIDKKLMTIGIPNGLEVLARNLSMIVLLKFVSMFGNNAVAAFGVAGRIFSFAFMPVIGLMMGGASIVGQSLGAEKIKRATKTAILTAVTSSLIMLVFSIIVFIFGKNIMSLFNNVVEVINNGYEFLKYGTIGLVFVGFGMGLAVVFSGSGFNRPFIYSSLISRWVVQIPILILTISILKLPLLWIWLSFVFGDIVEFLIFLKFYMDKKWLQNRV